MQQENTDTCFVGELLGLSGNDIYGIALQVLGAGPAGCLSA